MRRYSFMPANAALRFQSSEAAWSSWAAADGLAGIELVKILSRRVGHVRRGGEIDNRLCAPSWRYCEKLGKPDDARHQGATLVAKACGDEARMQAIRSDTCAAQTTSEFAREQNVAELRPTISFHGSEVLCRLKIIEIHRGALVRPRSGIDDAGRDSRLRAAHAILLSRRNRPCD